MAHPAAPVAPLKVVTGARTGAGLDGPADMGLVVAPSAPTASSHDWRDWVQAERAQGLADYHARITEARERRQRGPAWRQSRTLR
jgi:hypothetical protein